MATSKKKKSKKRTSGSSSKTRRQTTRAPKPPVAQPEEKASPAPAVVPDAGDAKAAAVDYGSEYKYVSKDLRQLAIVSLALFAVMLIVGFFM